MTLGIVTARGGSKGVPRKNLALVGGRSLVARAVSTGVDAGLPVILSTDDKDIQADGISAGAIASFLRPPHLATDTAGSVAVLQHAVEWYERELQTKVTTVVVLQPTSPLREAQDVRRALEIFEARPAGCRSLISVSEASHLNLSILYRPDADGRARQIGAGGTSRHDEPQLMIRNGAIYIAERDLVMKDGQVMCSAPLMYRMARWRGVNVDDHFDLYLAQLLAQSPPSGPAAEI